MSQKLAAVEHLLNCSICLETFKDPVSLSCNHNYCSKCLQKFWEKNSSKNCPLCKRKSSKDTLDVNFVLKQLADLFPGRQEAASSETVEEEKVELVCSKHKDKTKMFCEDEQKTVCSVCEFSHHQGHKVVSVQEAVRGLKEQLKCDLTALNDKKKTCLKVEGEYQLMMGHSKKQASLTERQIRTEFNNLHSFLKEEEASRVAALREEEEQKRQTVVREMEKVQRQVSSLSSSITAVEKELQKDPLEFLKSYKASQSNARDQCSQSDPQLVPGALIDMAKHLGNLSFAVWQKMKGKVRFSPVILDPNTANDWLYLSDDLTSVRKGETSQRFPDNPERHTKSTNVLGSEGFSSGQHSWEVAVGDHPVWNLGVVKESVDRKGQCPASPKHGMWCLSNRNGKYSNCDGGDVTLKKVPERVRVFLDFDRGQVSYYDAADMTHLCTHVGTFTEKVFPYFGVGFGDKKTVEIKICDRELVCDFGE